MNGDERMMDIIEAAQESGLYLQGHAPGWAAGSFPLICAAVRNTCHETTNGEEALGKLRAGMYVDARESSITKNVKQLWRGFREFASMIR